MMTRCERRKQKKKKNITLKIFIICFFVLFLIAIGVILFGKSVIDSYYSHKVDVVEVNSEMKANIVNSFNIELDDVDLTKIQGGLAKNIYKVVQKNPDIINIVLVGVDARPNETLSRSDTMILMSYNRVEHTVKLVSFLRDNWVFIPEYGWGKLNSATAYGGVGLLVNTLNENFDLDIQHYAEIRFEDFAEVIDILGGIDIELTQSEITYINGKLHREDRDYNNDIVDGPGLVHLNGVQALWHCRNRTVGDGDFKRTERQRDVLEVILNKGLEMNLTQITKLVYAMKDHVDMNIPINTIIGLARDVLSKEELSIESYKIPFDLYFKFSTKSGMSVIELNMEKTTDELHKIIGFIVEDRVEINGENKKISDIYSIEEKPTSKYVEEKTGKNVEVEKAKESGGLTKSTR